MCNLCIPKIIEFKERKGTSPWKLDRHIVADRLIELLRTKQGQVYTLDNR